MKHQWAYKIFSAIILVAFTLGLLPVKPAYAAATELNIWTLAASTGASGNNATINAGSLTVSAGTNRLFVAAVCMELSGGNTMTTLGISLGGTALTPISTTGGTNMTEQCWMGYLLNSQIPAGSNALTVPYNINGGGTTVTGAHVYWASYSGIDQTAPINDSNANSNGGTNVTFGQQIDFRQDGITFYIAANIGSPATMGVLATFTQQLVTTSNGHSSFISRITTVPHAANGNYAAATNVTFSGTTGARSSIVIASLRPFVGETTPGAATATAASNVAIDVSMPYTNDSNANNNYTVQYCLTSANCAVSGLWTNWVTGATHSTTPFNTTITGLSPATSYDVRVTYNDTDGFLGGSPQVQTLTNLITDACGPSLTYTAPAGANRVVVVAISNEGGGGGSAISNVQIGGVAATQIDLLVNNNGMGSPARLYVGYRVIGTSAVPQAMNISANNGECIYANTYSNINQTAGTGTNNTINDIATGTANSGTTTTSTTVTNQAGGRVIYAINMNNNGVVSTGTSGVWTFTELFDGNETGDTNRTAVGESTTTIAGSATISVGDGGSAHNRSVLIAFSLNPIINSTIVGVATATAASSSAIDVSMPYTHDNNANNAYTVQYCLTSSNCSVSGSWINWVVGASHTASPYTNTITGLLASTSYDIRVTYIDADGVTGTNPQTIINVVTFAPSSEMDVQGNGISIADGDGTPSLTDFTDFGNVPENFSIDRTFTILNTGAGNLTLGTIIFVGGDNGDFSVVTPPTSPVPPGGSTTFTIRLTADGGGGATRNTNIFIPNNDPNEAPYNFEIQGTRFNTEVEVLNINHNQLIPNLADCTQFPDTGLTGFSDCTYTIQNLSATNVLYIDPAVNFNIGTPGDFSVITPPASTVAPNGTTTFTVRFTPSAIGLRGTILTFVNNDSNESPYRFAIAGTAIANTPPTVTTPIADVNILEDAANTVFSLYPNFQDTENADPLLTYTITGNTNPGLFTSVSIVDPTNFTLDFAPDANGTSDVTIRATDTGGLFVEDTFQVTVTAVNDEPSFTASIPPTVNEDAGAQSIANWATVVSFGAANESGQAVSAYPVSNLSVSCATLLSAGPTVNATGDLSFAPATNANGTCTFDVAVQDNGGTANGGDDTSPTQTFTITVTTVNDEPSFTANNPSAVLEDAGLQTVTGWVTGVNFGPVDESGQSVLQYIISGSTCGTLLTADPVVNNAGDLSYTPVADQNGTCTFDVQVQDDGGTANGGDDTSPTQNFTITVTAVNDEPNFTAANPPSVFEDAGLQTVTGWVTAVDFGPADEDSSQAVLQYIVSNSTCRTLLTADPVINNAGELSYTPALNQNGTCTFDVQVQDDGGTANLGDDTSPPQNFTITVNSVNDEPSFTASNPSAVLEDAGLQTIAGWATFIAGPADEAGQSVLGYTVSNSTCTTLLTADPTVNNSGDLSYTPAINANGTCTFDMQVQDDGGTLNGGDDTSSTQNFTITVNAVNDEPSFTASNPPAVLEDAGLQTINGWATFTAGPANESGQSVLGYNVSNSTCGTLLTADPVINTSGDLSYTPALNQSGTCTFDVQVQDDGGSANGGADTSPTQTFTINVNTVNDEPSFTASNPSAVLEDSGLQTINGWVTFSPGPADESGQTVSQYIISGSTCATLLTSDPTVSTAGALTYTPATNVNGTCTFNVAVQDDGGTANGGDDTSPTQNFTITVTAVNDEPNFTANNPSAVLEDAGTQTNIPFVTAVDFGPADEDSSQSVLGYIVSGSTCGTLLTGAPTVNTAGQITYTPATNANGTCTFNLHVQDNGGTANGGDDTSPTQNFTITVTAVNDEPSFTASNPPAVYEDAGAQSIANWATPDLGPADEDGTQSVLNYTVSNSTCGTLLSAGPLVSNAGTLTYTPATDQDGTCTFDVTMQDNGGTANGGDNTSPTQNFTITITPQIGLTANITANNKAYDGNNTATFTCSLTGVTPPDVVTCTGGTATFADKNVGNGKLVTATDLALTGADAFKYELASTSATDNADITERTLNVTATGIDKVYDGTTAATVTLSDDRFLGDLLTVSYTSADFVDPNVGVNITINVSGISITGGADASNYVLGNTTAVTDADITIVGQTITVTTSAPASAANGSSFDVAATASSGLPVTITTSGSCSGGDTDGDATITMTSGTGTCSVFYDQAGNTNYSAAPQVQEDVNATESPVFTSVDNTSFDFGFSDTFLVMTTGNPSSVAITMSGEPAGITLTDNGNGTATLNYDGTTSPGVYTITFFGANGVLPNGTQTFTLTIRNGPAVSTVNSLPDTGNGSVSENENISTTLGITQIMVEFDRDVYDAGASDPDSVTNPANYLLVRSATGTFSTASCSGGLVAPDVQISVDSVTYDNGGGSGPFVATLNVNSGLPLNIAGFYRLFVCGTTSIVDAGNPLLALAGNGVTPGTDFTRNFRIAAPVTGGGGGGSSSTTTTTALTGLLIPVTGFTPSQMTELPAQPIEKEYAKSELTLKIPSLGVNLPIVGVKLDENGWDVTWLGNNAGYLEGSAYPTWNGNSILTSHVTDPNGKPGPFAYVNELRDGDKVYIHNDGFIYVYEVRESSLISPRSIKTLFKSEEDAWLTLVTCENFNEKTNTFTHRRVIRAVLISVIPEK